MNRVIIGSQLRTVLRKYVNTDFAFRIAAGARGGAELRWALSLVQKVLAFILKKNQTLKKIKLKKNKTEKNEKKI